jgi:hypothetical protein
MCEGLFTDVLLLFDSRELVLLWADALYDEVCVAM